MNEVVSVCSSAVYDGNNRLGPASMEDIVEAPAVQTLVQAQEQWG
jgi:hypothetical protein